MAYLPVFHIDGFNTLSVQAAANEFRLRHLNDECPIGGSCYIVGNWVFVKATDQSGFYVIAPDGIGVSDEVTADSMRIRWRALAIPYAEIQRLLTSL